MEHDPKPEIEVEHDPRLVFARRLVWDPEAWRSPGTIAFACRCLEAILEEPNTSKETLAEANMLLKQLREILVRPRPLHGV